MSDCGILESEDFVIASKSSLHSDDLISTNNLDEVEKMVIQRVMKQFQGNITQAANELGITRTSLYRRMEKYGL
jgi:transcriptional regulator with PAS, ATPase and Fis domain